MEHPDFIVKCYNKQWTFAESKTDGLGGGISRACRRKRSWTQRGTGARTLTSCTKRTNCRTTSWITLRAAAVTRATADLSWQSITDAGTGRVNTADNWLRIRDATGAPTIVTIFPRPIPPGYAIPASIWATKRACGCAIVPQTKSKFKVLQFGLWYHQFLSRRSTRRFGACPHGNWYKARKARREIIMRWKYEQ